MRVLAVGGNGFIGSHVVDALLARDHHVRVYDRQPVRHRAVPPGVEVWPGSLRDGPEIRAAMAGCDTVIHLAGTANVAAADADPVADVEGNLIGSLTLLQAMVATGVSRLIYLSSGGTVYGQPGGLPTAENAPLDPQSSYGIVKAATEQYIRAFQRKHGLVPVILRPANPYGPRQGHGGKQGVIATFLHRINRGEEIEIWGDGSVVRDYLYVADLADACVRAVEGAAVGTCNIGSGIGTSLNQIVRAIAEVTGRSIQPVYLPARAIDIPASVLDIRRAGTELGFVPRTGLHAGIGLTWAWIRSQNQR